MLSTGEILQNRYRIHSQIGQGGMGAVYEATDLRFGTPVALKEIVFVTSDERQRDSMAAAFEREAKALATIQHECIPFVRDYFSEGECQYLVMELVLGDDLGGLLENQGKPFPFEDALGWLRELLDVLHYLHCLTPPIIHRDIKPQNLKITSRKRLKLLDFGIAKSTDYSSRTSGGNTIAAATPNYSPIEQILWALEPSIREHILEEYRSYADPLIKQYTDERADIFATGSTFYSLLTSTQPENSLKRALAVWKGRTDPLCNPCEIIDTIPLELGNILMKAMEINREDRFPSAMQMLLAVNQLTDRFSNNAGSIVVSKSAGEAGEDSGMQGVDPDAPTFADSLKIDATKEGDYEGATKKTTKHRTVGWVVGAVLFAVAAGLVAITLGGFGTSESPPVNITAPTPAAVPSVIPTPMPTRMPASSSTPTADNSKKLNEKPKQSSGVTPSRTPVQNAPKPPKPRPKTDDCIYNGRCG